MAKKKVTPSPAPLDQIVNRVYPRTSLNLPVNLPTAANPGAGISVNGPKDMDNRAKARPGQPPAPNKRY